MAAGPLSTVIGAPVSGLLLRMDGLRVSGAAAAGGIALVNSIGNLAGFAGPYVMGWTRDATGSYVAGLFSLSAACLLSSAVVLALRDEEAIEARQPAAV